MPCDALLIPPSFGPGPSAYVRLDAVLGVAEPLLGVDRSQGGRAWLRTNPPGSDAKLFCSPSTDDTLYFPIGHACEGLPRYRWEPRADGIELGYLLSPEEVARLAQSRQAETIAAERERLRREIAEAKLREQRLLRYAWLLRVRETTDEERAELLALAAEFDECDED